MKILLCFLLLIGCEAFAFSVGQLENDVASAGTAEAISTTDLTVTGAVITAKSGNTGDIYVGTSSASSSAFGVLLDGGEQLKLTRDMFPKDVSGFNLKDLYIDAGTNDDGVTVLYFKE